MTDTGEWTVTNGDERDDALRIALKEWDEMKAEIAALRAKLEKAVQYLRQGKAQFAPHTTNSDVDVFLSQIDGGETTPLREDLSPFQMKVKIVTAVSKDMGWDQAKAMVWYTAPNPHFGGATPEELVNVGRGHKVMQFIDAARDENTPPKTETSHIALEAGSKADAEYKARDTVKLPTQGEGER